jgi:predicted transcriptional regulator
MLARLEIKGFVRHRQEENRYVYAPVLTKAKAERTALQQVVRTFFGGSPARAASALLGMSETLTASELDELEAMIARAREEVPQ